MNSAIGLIEYLKIPTGMVAADKMIKVANIEILEASVVCPGKYVVIFKGNLSEVKAAIDLGKREFEENLIDYFILGNPSEKIYKTIIGATDVEIESAVGIIESYSVATAVEAADIAVKTANVEIVELRLARGLCGKSYFVITGLISDVEASTKSSIKYLKEKGMYLDSGIIANPDENFKLSLY